MARWILVGVPGHVMSGVGECILRFLSGVSWSIALSMDRVLPANGRHVQRGPTLNEKVHEVHDIPVLASDSEE